MSFSVFSRYFSEFLYDEKCRSSNTARSSWPVIRTRLVPRGRSSRLGTSVPVITDSAGLLQAGRLYTAHGQISNAVIVRSISAPPLGLATSSRTFANGQARLAPADPPARLWWRNGLATGICAPRLVSGFRVPLVSLVAPWPQQRRT